ncbi:MAG: ABC-F family ATP-binding cassette domain-containing protein [Sphaerochaeta sp.]|jgi:ATP-binding cassette subfamily F protein uup|nr:ABC-F family ATP-binding cassette domain-containing protein [Sphaerochaeta sp.]
MSMVAVEGISKTLLEEALFREVSFTLEEGERAGLVGANGAGKSTLLKILSSRMESDSGTISYKKNIDIAVLEQQVTYQRDDTVASFLHNGAGRRIRATNAYQALLTTDHTQEQLASALEAMDTLQGWTLVDEYTSLLGEQGLFDILDSPMASLSGGMLKKVALARLFASGADLLLLDEPTNHLDIPTIEWLESKLRNSAATVVAVTHDRYFLDGVCHRILELDGATLYSHPTPFSHFLERRDERINAEAKEEERIRTILKRELAWLKRGPKARTGKDSARKERIEVLLASQEGRQGQEIYALSSLTRRLGKKILEAEDLSKSYGGRPVINAFTHSFQKGCKIGVIGANGSGKSTLLDLISGSIEPESGVLEIGVNTAFGYLRQTTLPFPPQMTIIEVVEEIAKVITIAPKESVSAAKLLELYGFPASMHRKGVTTLSGGEQRRLALVTTLMAQPNFLLLDEPTNDLDLAMMENLEEYLTSFGGCLLVSSHDRAFLDLVCDELFVLDGSGAVTHHSMGYSQWKERQHPLPPAVSRETSKQSQRTSRQEKKKGLSRHEERQLAALEERLEELADTIASLEESFSSPLPTEAGTLEERTRAYHDLKIQLTKTEEAWLSLAERV